MFSYSNISHQTLLFLSPPLPLSPPPPLSPPAQGLHSASVPGILCLDVSGDTSRALTGGADKTAVVFEHTTEQVVATLRGHTKKVTSVVHHNKEVLAHTHTHTHSESTSLSLSLYSGCGNHGIS